MSSSPSRPVFDAELAPHYAVALEGTLFGSISVDGGRTSRPPLIGGRDVRPPDESKPLEELTREAYIRMIDDARASGHPHFLRIWNHVGGINEVEDGVERYQRFCAGRHDAFVERGYPCFPAASAVGMQGSGLVTYFLASREPGVQIENPRQVSAYRYPSQYGAKSPSFSRATRWRDLVFVSGTASIVGHDTMHRGDVVAQIEETLRNLDAVLVHAGSAMPEVIGARTYLRRADDIDLVAPRLDALLPFGVYLEADICRADLLIEIEVIARATR
ncbi:MAG TPA: Rid family hydrolase [Thermoanaerobaculia bacterium]|nr:Rid family hydrolase [Thermoanaerobaculia bacterium]